MRPRKLTSALVVVPMLGVHVVACGSPCPPLSHAQPPVRPTASIPPFPDLVLRPSAYCMYHPETEACWTIADYAVIDPYPPRGGFCELMPDAPQCAVPHPLPKPRCTKTDPSCGPQYAAGGSEVDEIRTEQSKRCFRPEGARVPSRRGMAGMTDPCTYDGECLITQCGRCAGYERQYEICYRTLIMEGPVETQPLAWCGCVLGRCTVFTQ
jgi:hypothetical protein